MNLTINGEPRDVDDDMTVRQLLELLKVPTGRVAVELNLEIVRKDNHDTQVLKDGDRLEIVTFVGGG